jgi:hypothetical protein
MSCRDQQSLKTIAIGAAASPHARGRRDSLAPQNYAAGAARALSRLRKRIGVRVSRPDD